MGPDKRGQNTGGRQKGKFSSVALHYIKKKKKTFVQYLPESETDIKCVVNFSVQSSTRKTFRPSKHLSKMPLERM